MEIICPVCESPLPAEKYNLAIQKLQQKVTEINQEQLTHVEHEFQTEKELLLRKYRAEIEVLRKAHENQLGSIEHELKRTYDKEFERIRQRYNELDAQHQDELKRLENQMKCKYEQNLESMASVIKKLEMERTHYKNRASEEAKQAAQIEVDVLHKDIMQRDIQLLRFKEEVDSLKKQISQSQAELKGEAGEIDLYAKLTEAFPEDQFRRQTRGRATGDIVQQIRTKAGIVDIPIVYDNKEADSITTNDIAKAKKYQQIHGTKYVVIVSTRLPKREVKSGLLGDKDGIYLVHPSILLPFVKYLREAIIELSMMSKSERERDSKEVMLYEYIRSQEFTSRMERISRIETQFNLLQNKEEKEHEKMWKDRKGCISQLEHEQMEISLRIQGILSRKEDDGEPAVISNPNERRKIDSSS